MNWTYLFASWSHVLAAMFWVGGMLFLSFVIVPTLKNYPDPVQVQSFFLAMARRFRTLVWGAIGVLFSSGAFLLSARVELTGSVSEWAPIVMLKLLFVFLLLGISIGHDRIIGPKVRNIQKRNAIDWTLTDRVYVTLSPWMGRLTMILGVVVVLVGTVLVRDLV